MLIHKQSRQIRWPRFDGHSGKFAYRPIGQRGDPLKIVLYRISIGIAGEKASAGSRTHSARSVAVLSATAGKKGAFQALCIATASRGQKHQHTEIHAHSTLSVFRCYSVDKASFGPPVEPFSLTIACEASNFLRFCTPVWNGCSYINRAVRFDGSVSTAIAGSLHTDPSGKGGTL